MILLPIVFLLEFFLYFYHFCQSYGEAFIWASLVFSCFTVFIIELLSIPKLITQSNLSLIWLFAIIVLSFLLYRLRPLKHNINFNLLKDISIIYRIIFILIGIIIFTTFITALIAPPNNYDSMTYHMARVVHWVQNQSVDYYPTFILRQLYYPPGAEYLILNFQVLAGNDHFANLVQWFSMLGSIVVIVLIVKMLDSDFKSKTLAAFFVATIPMGILQATSTQNDYVAAFWLLCFVYFVLKPINYYYVFGASMALGLAILTKPTSYFISIPFILWYVVNCINKIKLASWKPLILMIAIILLINSGFYLRNQQLFNSPVMPDRNTANSIYAPNNIILNMTKYFSSQMNSPFPFGNKLLYEGVVLTSNFLNVDMNDNRTSGFGDFIIERYAPHEDIIGNPIHLLLIFTCGIFFFCISEMRTNKKLLLYYCSLLVGFVLLFIFLKYQLGFNRLTLPIFVLFSPIIGIYMKKILAKKALIIVIGVMIVIALPPLLMNIKKPIIPPPFAHRSQYSILNTPRQFFYFGGGRQEEYESYKKIADLIKFKRYKNIGMINVNDEYPLWVLLKGQDVRIEHVYVDNLSSAIRSDFLPDAIIVFGLISKQKSEKLFAFNDRAYIGKDIFGEDVRMYGR